MKSNLSTLGLLWISLTSMIGSGWLFGALYSAHFAGPAAILAWPIAGFLLLFVALSYAEVASMFPQADSLAKLPFYTHGHLTSVMLSGMAWISLATIPVIETQGLVQYASNYLPGLVIQHSVFYTSTFLGYCFALIILFSFVLLNFFGLRLFARINAGFTVWKLVIPSLTIILLLTVNYHVGNFTQYGGFMPYGFHGVMSAMSSGGVLFSLLGFRQTVLMMSEIENPGKYVPIILFVSLIFTSLLYTCLQWSFIASMRPQDLLHGWANLTFPGDAGPFAAIAASAGMIWLSILLYTDAFISPYSTGLVYTVTATRMLSSMGAMHDVPPILAKTNKYQVPWISLCVNFLLAASMFFLLHNWQAMASFLVATLMISYAVGPLCLINLRKQLPKQPRPFQLRYGGIISLIGFYVCTAGVYWSGFESIKKLCLLTGIGLALYFLYSLRIKKISNDLDSKHSAWLWCYLLGLFVFSYFGNYGGKGFIPQYWDLIALFIFSCAIFWFSLICSKEMAG